MTTLTDNKAGVSTTAGTGSVVISGPLAQFHPIIGNIPDATPVSYKIQYADSTNGTDYETGTGAYASGSQTVSRLVINTSSNSNNAVEWSGAQIAVFIVADAATINSMENKTETATAKVMTGDERTKLTGIEAGADVTDVTNVTAAGAVMDSELTSLTGVKTLTVPDSTTITTFGASLVDDLAASNARTTLELGGAAILNVGQVAGTVAAGDDARLTGTEVSALPAADPLDGTETVPMLQGGLAVTATTEDIAADPPTACMAVARDKIRRFSHLIDAAEGFTSSTTGDYFGNEAAVVWCNGAAAAEVTQDSGGKLASGVAVCDAGTSLTGFAGLTDTIHMVYVPAASIFTGKWLASVNVAPNGTDTYVAQIGYVKTPTSIVDQGLFFRARNGSANWQAVTRDGSSETETDTLIPITSSGWLVFEIDHTANTAVFRINGALVATHTTTLPAILTVLYPGVTILKSAGTISRQVIVDAYSLDLTVGAPTAVLQGYI